MRHRAPSGFTLIELTLTMAIIAILSTLALPKFSNIVTKAKEAKIKGQLAGLRGALTIYIADNGAEDLTSILPVPQLAPTYIAKIPILEIPGHQPSNNVRFGLGAFPMLTATDWGEWIFIQDGTNIFLGIACIHKDSSGKNFISY